MEPYQERVIEEKAELDAKIVKLACVTSNPFGGPWVLVTEEERGRLSRQLSLMCQYSTVLGERIAAFMPEESVPGQSQGATVKIRFECSHCHTYLYSLPEMKRHTEFLHPGKVMAWHLARERRVARIPW